MDYRYKYVLVFIVATVIGWISKGIYIDIQELTCSDFSTKHAMWKGFSASKNGQLRCFWLEDKYPWRVRQGVAD